MKRVLVISPHPDDEAIGCGGALCRHVIAGDEVEVIFLTSGENGGHGIPAAETCAMREGEARAAAKLLGINRVEFCREPDGRLEATRANIERIQRAMQDSTPACVYVTHDQEMHSDHRAAYEIVRQSMLASSHRPDVLTFEVWTPLRQFDEVVDISPYVEIKRAAIRTYRSQCAVMAFDEAILGLNRYRGEMHLWPGGDYAEVFGRMVL